MSHLVHRLLRAPQEDGAALIDPALKHAAAIIQHNRSLGAQFDRVAWFPSDYRKMARLSAAAAARVIPDDHKRFLDAPFILSGHQPELFHPGVWMKSFLLSSIARSVGGTALNLIIDSDLARHMGIRVPTVGASAVIDVPFDVQGEQVPWEERAILDANVFKRFAATVRTVFGHVATSPSYHRGLILDQLWPHAIAHEAVTERWPTLAFALAVARNRLERELGLINYELPLSSYCLVRQLEQFADHLFARCEEFHEIYNSSVAEYRAVNHIRDRSHPVPDLDHEGDFYEMPFWIWSRQDPRRRRVFVRRMGSVLDVTDRQAVTFPSTIANHSEISSLVMERGI